MKPRRKHQRRATPSLFRWNSGANEPAASPSRRRDQDWRCRVERRDRRSAGRRASRVHRTRDRREPAGAAHRDADAGPARPRRGAGAVRCRRRPAAGSRAGAAGARRRGEPGDGGARHGRCARATLNARARPFPLDAPTPIEPSLDIEPALSVETAWSRGAASRTPNSSPSIGGSTSSAPGSRWRRRCERRTSRRKRTLTTSRRAGVRHRLARGGGGLIPDLHDAQGRRRARGSDARAVDRASARPPRRASPAR